MISLSSPVRTWAHGWPAAVKLGLLALGTAALFSADAPGVQVVSSAMILALYALPGRAFFAGGLGSLRIVLPFAVVIVIWHAITGDLWQGVLLVLRMGNAVALANLVTMTTPLGDFMELLRRICRPLRRLGLPTQMLELAVPLVIRFTPVLIGRGQHLSEAWRARARRRPGVQLVLPLLLSAMDDADQVAEALRARGGIHGARPMPAPDA